MSVLLCLFFRRRQKMIIDVVDGKPEFCSDGSLEGEFKNGAGPRRFRYNELATATDNFSDKLKLGEGGHKIVLEIATAILYLHQEWEQCVLHRDIKPSNVMLDASFNAKLGDFGLARLVDHGQGSHTTVLAGTIGYMDPECMVTGRASAESIGRLQLRRPPPRDRVRPEPRRLPGRHHRDPPRAARVGASRPGEGPRRRRPTARRRVFDAEEMECVVTVGLRCTHPDRSVRPSIRQAVNVLRFEAPLPSFPAGMIPMAAYKSPAGLLEGLFPNSTGGYIKGYSCYLRYQVGAFNISLSPAPLPSPQPAPGPSSSSNTGLVIGISVGSISFLIILGFSTCLLLRRRRKQSKILEEAMEQELENGGFCDDEEFEKRTGPKRFRYGELAIATDNFADDRKLGEGGFGSVYRGFLKEMNLEVAIKRVSKGSKQGRKEYASEVRIISRLRHRNLVQLIGWCHGGGELLLVYELMPNGSLDRHLYSSASDGALLPWPRRHEIVLGLGSALLYLHEEWEQCVVHRDIKPSNVMLDASFNAKLGDFGLARLVDHGRGSHTTELAGTTGYMDPECTVTGRFSTGSDMYSFGVLLLEVACGRRPVVVLPDDAVIHLAQRLSELHGRGMVLHAADPRLNGEFDAKEMECVLVVGLWCTQQDWSMRPSIRQAVSALRFEAPLPSLPARLPVAATTYAPSPGSLLNSVPSLLVADSTRTGTM
ncbi:L-type lectin-domain containing receptor kinase IX.1 [Dichanthelium oligosanthes]|uniref:L-type lectin-domain containing receptor kinase IX.1 n=1 Tax=Dichanthelium oligosanthes TaxID=888268 RepID=A0A1E5WHG3_9POAL|nr:L-type lectin-domain containing receptor kinase IX.1 [Dichanthelium oligosanthes]